MDDEELPSCGGSTLDDEAVFSTASNVQVKKYLLHVGNVTV